MASAETMTSRVEPRTLKGFQDYLPAQAIQRARVIARLCPLVERYGFVPVDTPMVEALDVLLGTGGEATNKELFRFFSPEEEPVALRFDLTVPFARLLAQYPDELKSPFRRYAFGPVFRADKPGPGRYRQFTQFDFDHAGSGDVAVDAEICALMCDAMRELGATPFRLHISSRLLIDALLAECGIADLDRQRHVLRVVDKLDKIGLNDVRRELGPGRTDESGDKIRGVGLDDATIARLEAFLAIQRATRVAIVEAVAAQLAPSKQRDDAIAEMRELAAALDALGVGEDEAIFDPSLTRGLDYYTGPVFEMRLADAPQFGSVMGGGRYDGLVSRFSSNEVAATGGSIGIDRLLAALAFKSGEKDLPQTTTHVLIVTFKAVAKQKYLDLATELRRAGLNTEVYFGRRKSSISDQLSHANSRGIPVAIIAGDDEFGRGEVAIKDLTLGAEARADIADRDAYREAGKAGQQSVARTDMVRVIREILAHDRS